MTAAASSAGAARKIKLGLLHQAKAKLQISDEDYRDRLEREFGVRSAAELSAVQLNRAIDLFHVKRDSSLQPHAKLAKALWIALGNLGAVERTDTALDAFVTRQTGKQTLRFLTAAESNSVTEALKAMCAREGFDVKGDPRQDRAALLRAQWKKMHTLGLSNGDVWALDNYVSRKYLSCHGTVFNLTVDQLDDCARSFGARIRTALARQYKDAAAA